MIWGNIGIFAVALISAIIATAFATAQAGLGFVRVHTETMIAAPPEAVWATISAFDRYHEWNPLMITVAGEARAGARMNWSSRINGNVRQYNADVARSDAHKELSWIGPAERFPRTLFWGHHRLLIEKADDGRTRFVNAEEFGGILSLVLAGFLRGDVRDAYLSMNEAVRVRAERS